MSAKCPVAKKCGGCQLTNLSYPEQLSFKQVKVIRLLKNFCHVDEIIGMENPYHYRNKVQAAFGADRHGNIISGVYQSSTHNIVPVDSCGLEDEDADRIIVTVRRMLGEFRLTAYNDRTGKGFLRHILIRKGFASGQIMLVLVTGTDEFPRKNDFIAELLRRHPGITTIVQNVNDKFTSLVLGEKQTVLYGDGYITDTLCGCSFRISPKSFYQINPVQTEILYNTAMRFAALKKDSVVLDAYCGVGTIGLVAAASAGKVIGVELNADAVKDAKINASLNGIENAEFYCADAGRFMAELAQRNTHIDTVFMDPPRAGSDVKFLSSVVRLSPSKVVYISCNPETQARDLLYLTRNGYRVKKIQPVDMFPHTSHIETVVLLTAEKTADRKE